MRINNNVSAVISNNKLLGNENALAASMERISSGLKLNHASDNPAGMAISNKMRAQIRGLDQASRNSDDGISVIQTADGALSEVHDMLQRMRELSIQAANGTNSLDDRKAIQEEITSLKSEIDRISSATEFNDKPLLDGSADAHIYADGVDRIQVSQYVNSGEYDFEIKSAATQAEITGFTDVSALPTITESGTVYINGYGVDINKGMSGEEIYEALRNGAEVGEAILSDKGTPLTFTSKAYGAHAEMNIKVEPAALAFELGLPTSKNDVGKNADVELKVANPTDPANKSLFSSHATVAYDGNKLTISDTAGFKMTMMLDEKYIGDVSLNVTDVGIMDLQIGSNEGQSMQTRIPSTDCKHLYIDDLDVSTVNGPHRAMDLLDDAIARISEVRSRLGAYENRLEHTSASLDQTSENMTQAMSRIADVDMATEMVEYTKYNVLEQAGISALSQANDLPNLALQILQ